MIRGELPKMASYLYNNGVRKMVEIGCARGISTKVWRDAGILVYGVDPYIAGYDSADGQSTNHSCSTARNEFLNNVVDNQTIFHIDKNSNEAAKDFEDNSLDFVYIDGCHKYKAVKNDILTWIPKVKSGMFLGGDDFTRIDKHSGDKEVAKAFIEVIGEPHLTFYNGHVLYKLNKS